MELNKSQTDLFEESKIRGLCAAHSADMEGLLLRLILYCTIDDNDKSIIYRKFNRLTLGKKMEWAESDLKKHYPQRLLQLKADFKELKQFNKFRGHLIHCDFAWIDESYNEFSVLTIQKINGQWRVVPITYTKSDVAKKLAHFGKTIINFATTTQDIINIVSKKYPELTKPSKAS